MSDLFALDSKKCLIDISGKILESSIIPIPTTLSDGSVIVYDRGEQYGEYNLTDGVLIRISEGEDSGSYDDVNWRYLIVDNEDLDGSDQPTSSKKNKDWGPNETINLLEEDIGYGLYYSNILIEKYGNNSSYLWYNLKRKRTATNYEWFLPCNGEILLLYYYKDNISNLEIPTSDTVSYYYSCNTSTWANNQCCGIQLYNAYLSNELGKNGSGYSRVRLMRRI